jgi:hypothetical protein
MGPPTLPIMSMDECLKSSYTMDLNVTIGPMSQWERGKKTSPSAVA